MDVLVFMIPIALTLGLAALGAFLWSLNSGQFDDIDGAEYRVIMDDDEPPRPQVLDRHQRPAARETA
jgi:cbb3-type cytochrome oxidase maturation protein